LYRPGTGKTQHIVSYGINLFQERINISNIIRNLYKLLVFTTNLLIKHQHESVGNMYIVFYFIYSKNISKIVNKSYGMFI